MSDYNCDDCEVAIDCDIVVQALCRKGLIEDYKQLQAELDLKDKRIYGLREERKHLRIKDEARLELLEELEQYRWIPVSEKPEVIKPYNHSKDIFLIVNNCGSHGYYDGKEGFIIYSAYEKPEKYQDTITHWRYVILPTEG